jgi:hypothetical protein
MALCKVDGCRLLEGHAGNHDKYPTSAWNFFLPKDRNKINKAGFATPRGGAKSAYQNHVTRNNKVIIPFERIDEDALNLYQDGYVIRLYPEQYFASPNTPKQEFLEPNSTVRLGVNSFILYRTWGSFNTYPPLPNWQLRTLTRNGVPVDRRGAGVVDAGHYILRMAPHGNNPKRYEGPPQGIFATEYADEETNYLCKCVLSFLIINTLNSPYTLNQAEHLKQILTDAELLSYEVFEQVGSIRRNFTCCPLCLKIIRYEELHEMVSFDESLALANAANQVEGATRSTIVNLFHLKPLIYHSLVHIPVNLGWGHAVCNTYLGQRECISLHDLIEEGLKIGILYEDHMETFGWISQDYSFIRSPNGAVWVQISSDMSAEELAVGIQEKESP